MARSESNAIVGKVTYPDLNMTHYPDKIDSRVPTDEGYNPNLRGFENRKDYNLAEHVNALDDAVMAIQRALGAQPYIDKDGVNKNTVSERIRAIEMKNHDTRYGGVGWNPSQTLVGHTHTGEPGHPSKIDLTKEVMSKLPKANLDLSQTTGLTGADIAVSKDISTKVSDAINDKLSVTQGGTIQKNLTVKGKVRNRFYVDLDAMDVNSTQGMLITDYTTRTEYSRKFTYSDSDIKMIQYDDNTLEYGKYVACVRLKISQNISSPVFRLEAINLGGGGTAYRATKVINGTDFDSLDWQTFYLVFENKATMGSQVLSNNIFRFNIWKLKTKIPVDAYIDYIHICPAHPAIYDM